MCSSIFASLLWRRLLSCVLIAFSPPLLAQLTLCNTTSDTINVAIHVTNSQGWWILKPSQCRTILNNDITNKYISIYTEPGSRVRGLTPWGGGGRFSTCVSDSAFTYVQSSFLGCQPPYRDAKFIAYLSSWSSVTWNLEPDPDTHLFVNSRRGTRVGPPQINSAAPRPTWTAGKGTTSHSLTSKSGRKDQTTPIDGNPNQYICTYRIREISNIGDGNHWHLSNAYHQSGTKLTMSVKPEYLDIGGGWAEVHGGDRATLRLEIDWYIIEDSSGRSLDDLYQEVNKVVSMDREKLKLGENTNIRAAFNNEVWPSDIQCGDRPASADKERKSRPAAIPNMSSPPAKPYATLRVYCIRKDNGTSDGSEHDLVGYGDTCNEARGNAKAKMAENRCSVGHPYRTNGFYDWMSTPYCKVP